MPLMRGALPSPRHKLAAAEPHKPAGAPPQYANVPAKISMWGNSQYGDCVTAEEAFAKSAAAPNVFVTDQDVIRWAGQHGYLNGANLTDVMDDMIRSGLPSGGKTYQDGHYVSVDWTNRTVLCDAIFQGPVKIAVAASQLQGAGAGNGNGWFGHGFRRDQDTDHCVALTGYGPLAFLFQSLGKPVPAGADPAAFGYLLFTWDTIGVIDEPSMVAITAEAWLRKPTTAGFDPPPVPPVPPVPPIPPEPPVNPNYVVTVSGQVPSGIFGGKVPVTLTGTATPAPGYPAWQFEGDYSVGHISTPAAPNYLAILMDLAAVLADFRAKNYVALAADVQKLIADLGLTL